MLEHNKRQSIKQNLPTSSAKPCNDVSQGQVPPLDVPVRVPDAAERSPDIGWPFGEATCFLQGGGSPEQTASVPCLQAIRGWEERAEHYKADSSSHPLPLEFFPFLLSAGMRREDAWVPSGSPAASARSPEAHGERYLGSSTFHAELHSHPGICQPLQQLLQIQGEDDTKGYAEPAGS